MNTMLASQSSNLSQIQASLQTSAATLANTSVALGSTALTILHGLKDDLQQHFTRHTESLTVAQRIVRTWTHLLSTPKLTWRPQHEIALRDSAEGMQSGLDESLSLVSAASVKLETIMVSGSQRLKVRYCSQHLQIELAAATTDSRLALMDASSTARHVTSALKNSLSVSSQIQVSRAL